MDALINSQYEETFKIGITMGSLLMMRIPNIALTNIVEDDFSMEKIN